jgi:hypothetical protein
VPGPGALGPVRVRREYRTPQGPPIALNPAQRRTAAQAGLPVEPEGADYGLREDGPPLG